MIWGYPYFRKPPYMDDLGIPSSNLHCHVWLPEGIPYFRKPLHSLNFYLENTVEWPTLQIVKHVVCGFSPGRLIRGPILSDFGYLKCSPWYSGNLTHNLIPHWNPQFQSSVLGCIYSWEITRWHLVAFSKSANSLDDGPFRVSANNDACANDRGDPLNMTAHVGRPTSAGHIVLSG